MPLLKRVLLILTCFLFLGAKNTWAGCTVSVSPNNVTMGTSSVSTFSVSNTGEQMGNWVRIQSPNLTAYSIANMQATGWYPNGSGTEANFAGGYLESGTSADFALTLAETGEVISSMDWEALLSYDGGGSFESCGSVSLQVVPAPRAPNISNASLTVGNSSATLTWNTDLTSTGVVNFGPTTSYGYTASSTTNTSHSATLTDLTASTLYHYQIQVTSEGGTTTTQDATFTTTAASTTTTITNTVTTTTTVTNSITNTQTIADIEKPIITLNTKFDTPFDKSPTLTGKVTDKGAVNAGINTLEYSLDAGQNWHKIDDLSFSSSQTTANFEAVLPHLDDGNYPLRLRAKDNSGNISQTPIQTLIIDRLPPLVGNIIFNIGPLILKPDRNGLITSSISTPLKISLFSVGGPTKITLSLGDQKYHLNQNKESGLWSAVLSPNQTGTFPLSITSIDGANNQTTQNLSQIYIQKPLTLQNEHGKPLKGTIEIFTEDSLTKRFVSWQAENYLQQNPTLLAENHSLTLPEGRYYLKIKSAGYRPLQTTIFSLSNPISLSGTLTLHRASFLSSFFPETVHYSPSLEAQYSLPDPLLGSQFPNQISLSNSESEISLLSLVGQTSIITFLSPNTPETADQLKELEALKTENKNLNISAVFLQSSVSQTKIIQKLGRYNIPFFADADAATISPLNLTSLPTHIFVDRKGIIKDRVVGYQNANDLTETVLK